MALFKKKERTEHTPLPDDSVDVLPGGLTVIKIQSIGILLITLVVLLTSYFTYLIYADQIIENQQLTQEVVATQLAATIKSRIHQIKTTATRIAKNSDIIAQLQNHPVDTITLPLELEQSLRVAIPELIRALLISDNAHPSTSVVPPLGLACIDLAKNGAGQLALHQFSSDGQHIDISVPIEGFQGQQIRYLILTLEPSMFDSWVQELTPAGNYTELAQQVGGAHPLVIATAGDSSLLQRNTEAHPIAMQDNSLILTVRHDHLLSTNEQQRISFLAGFVVELLMIPVILLFLAATMRAILRHDMETLLAHIKNYDGPRQHMTAPIKLQLFRRAMAQLEQILRPKGAEPATEPNTEKPTTDENGLPLGPAPLPEVDIKTTQT
jgi:hypothetical protein